MAGSQADNHGQRGARPPVGEGGLEPPPPCGDMALNHARLPVPPLALAYALNLRKTVLSGCSGSIAAVQIAVDARMANPATGSNWVENRSGSDFGSATDVMAIWFGGCSIGAAGS